MCSDRPWVTGRCVVICDYTSLLLSVTGVLQMAGYSVFQAPDSAATEGLCLTLPDIGLLIVNAAPNYASTRAAEPGFPISVSDPQPTGHPGNIPTLSAPFSPERLVDVVDELFTTATA